MGAPSKGNKDSLAFGHALALVEADVADVLLHVLFMFVYVCAICGCMFGPIRERVLTPHTAHSHVGMHI